IEFSGTRSAEVVGAGGAAAAHEGQAVLVVAAPGGPPAAAAVRGLAGGDDGDAVAGPDDLRHGRGPGLARLRGDLDGVTLADGGAVDPCAPVAVAELRGG